MSVKFYYVSDRNSRVATCGCYPLPCCPIRRVFGLSSRHLLKKSV